MTDHISGARIRELRESAGLTQTELGSRLKLRTTGNGISRWERETRRCNAKHAKRLAKALGVDVGALS
jgi:transcriptional regulator with XRE-family HTH domain